MTNIVNNEDKIKKSIEASMAEIQVVDDGIIGETIGVAQALDHLRKALDKVDECLDKRQYEKASGLGYSDVASEFIFLQRTLGGLQHAYHQKQKLVSEIALKSGVGVYEEVEPFVDAVLVSSKELSEEEKKKNKEIARKFLEDRKSQK